MALFFHERGYEVALDEATHQVVQELADEPKHAPPGIQKRLAALVRAARPLASDSAAEGVMIASNGTGSSGVAGQLIERWRNGAGPQIVFTGHLGKDSPAERLVGSGRASLVRWNVHPPLHDNLWLVHTVQARQVIPAFLKMEEARAMGAAFGEASVSTDRVVAI
jgi:hypothetical protein